MCFGTRVLIYVPAVLKSNEKRPTHASCVAQKHYICNSKNSRRLLRFTFANGPRLFSRQIAQVEFSGSQKYCGHLIAAHGMKTDGSAATDRLVVRMGSNNKNIHPTFPLSTSTLLPQRERE